MRSRLRTVLLLFLVLAACGWADSLRTADSAAGRLDELSVGCDSALAAVDTLARGSGVTDRWLWPLALAAVSFVGVYLLYSVRSK
jgi:hypothetical protein